MPALLMYMPSESKFMNSVVIYQSVRFGRPLQREQRRLGHDGGFGLHDGIEGPNLHHPVHIQTGHFSARAVHPKTQTQPMMPIKAHIVKLKHRNAHKLINISTVLSIRNRMQRLANHNRAHLHTAILHLVIIRVRGG